MPSASSQLNLTGAAKSCRLCSRRSMELIGKHDLLAGSIPGTELAISYRVHYRKAIAPTRSDNSLELGTMGSSSDASKSSPAERAKFSIRVGNFRLFVEE